MKKMILSIIVTLLLLTISLSSVNAIILKKPVAEKDLQLIKKITYPSGWTKLTDDGFGQIFNVAIRGMAIYKNELYVGTHNLNLTKLRVNENPNINIETNVIVNILEERLSTSLVQEKLLADLAQENQLLNLIQKRYLLKSYAANVKVANLATNNRYSYNDLDFGMLSPLQKLPIQGVNLLTRIVHIVNRASDGCNVYKYNFTTGVLTQIVGDDSETGMKSGFGYTYNCDASIIKVFNDKLYVGTWNTGFGSKEDPDRKGCEIWRFDGENWEQVVGHESPIKGGFGNSRNVAAWSIKEFNGYLYVGTMNWGFTDDSGCEIWRTQDGENWEKVVDKGFKPFMSPEDQANKTANTYTWGIEEYQGKLYVGTFNCKMFSDKGWGCQLWRSNNGIDWNKVDLPGGDGFGEPENYGIRKLTIYNNELFIGTATHILNDEAFEIWKFDGIDWTPIIGDDVPGVEEGDTEFDGFGNPMNKYAWSMIVTSDNKLWVGTGNLKMKYSGDLISEGCEIWYYDGNDWIPVVKDGFEEPNGFGNIKNQAARAMIEYPEGSNNIVVGTLRIAHLSTKIPQTGCDLRIRIP